MTEKLRQSLSAAMDDEADAFELRRVLDELGRDDALKALWDRYHIIGQALRGEPMHLEDGLRERVWAALDETTVAPVDQLPTVPAVPAVAPATEPERRSRLGRYTGLAIAASVAFAVVIGLNGLVGNSTPAPAVADNTTDAAVTRQDLGGPDIAPERGMSRLDASSREISPSDVQRAHAYMLHHAQQQALNQTGVMSFVKLATYEAP